MPTQETSNEPDTVDSGRNQSNSKSRRNNKNNRNQQGKQKKGHGDGSKIKGDIEELGYNVYLIGSPHQADMYTTTTKAITDYMEKDCSADIRTLVLKYREARIVKPK